MKMISKTLKSLRIQNGYTQQNVAEFLGIDRSTYSYYETGKTRPSTEVLARLSFLYHVSIDDFVPSSYKKASDLNLECSIPEGLSLYENTERFSNLTFEEQQLVLYFRACTDKRGFIDAVLDVVERDTKSEEKE